jgi:putative transposase
MPRIVRGLADNIVYHVINRGNGRREVFHKDKDYEAFLKLIAEAKERYSVKLYGYCLMQNHFHMAVRPERGEDLSKWMQWLMTSHVRRYHKHYGSSGHVWQGRYKSFMIQTDSHLLMVLRYIEGNPLRAGLVGSAKEWTWSSQGEVAGIRQRTLVDEALIELPDEWSKYVDTPFTEKELERVRQSVNRQSPYGDIMWQMKMSKDYGLESTIRLRGRPKKEPWA